MFNENYKKAMDSINPQAQTKEKILDEIILKEELRTRKNPAIVWRIAFACVACVAIMLGIIFVPKNNFVPTTNNSDAHKTLAVSKSYDEIYKLINPKRVKKKVIARDGAGTEEVYVEEEMAYGATNVLTDGVTMSGGSANQNASVDKSSALKGESADDSMNGSEKQDFSTTTEQVEGVAEADIVKTDGEYIYYLIGNQLSIYKADGENSSLVSNTLLDDERYGNYGDMFLKDDRLILLQPDYYKNDKNYVAIIIYDITNPKTPKQVAKSSQEGRYNSSRMVGDYMYLISNCYINVGGINKDDPATFVPTVETNDICKVVPADSIYRYEEENYNNQYTVIGAFNYKDGNMSDTVSLLGGTDNIYCSKGNIILADTRYNESENKESYVCESTVVSKLAIKEGKIEYKTTGEVDGILDNQFFIDQHDDYFRFVTTVTKAIEKRRKFANSETMVVTYTQETTAQLTILDSELKKVGEIGDLAQGERVYSVRFMGDTAYFVTFRQTDPLFSADLSDPTNPKILGELKIPGFSEYMYPYGDGLLLGFGMDADEQTGRTKDLKLSMFNITDPSNVTEQDKTVVEGYNHSTALENHKAMLVSPTKNLIGFVAFDNQGFQTYMIYEHTDGGFNLKAKISPPYTTNKEHWSFYDSIRGLFIGEHFYLVSDVGLQAFDINTFSQIAIVEN